MKNSPQFTEPDHFQWPFQMTISIDHLLFFLRRKNDSAVTRNQARSHIKRLIIRVSGALFCVFFTPLQMRFRPRFPRNQIENRKLNWLLETLSLMVHLLSSHSTKGVWITSPSPKQWEGETWKQTARKPRKRWPTSEQRRRIEWPGSERCAQWRGAERSKRSGRAGSRIERSRSCGHSGERSQFWWTGESEDLLRRSASGWVLTGRV